MPTEHMVAILIVLFLYFLNEKYIELLTRCQFSAENILKPEKYYASTLAPN